MPSSGNRVQRYLWESGPDGRPQLLAETEPAELGLTTSNLPAVQPLAPSVGSSRWVSVPCRYADRPDTPVPASQFTSLLLGTGYPSLDHYWRELSYDAANLAGSQSLAWRTLPRPYSYYLYDANGDGVLMSFNGDVGCCAWGGGWSITADGVTKDVSMTWLPAGSFGSSQGVIAHEMGHGFGLPHLYSEGVTSLRWDVMASGGLCNPPHPTFGCVSVHTNTAYKEMLDWVPSARKVTVPPGSAQTIRLDRLAQPPAAPTAVMVKAPILPTTTQFYAIESRRFQGYDVQVPGEAVVIYAVDDTRVDRAAVVDADTNGDRDDAGAMWTAGESYTDAASGLVIRVEASTGTGHLVTVMQPRLSGPPCTYSVAPMSATQPGRASVGVLSVTAPSGCLWNALSDTPWIQFTAGTSGSGTAEISYTLAQNPGAQRAATIYVAGQHVSVTQLEFVPCSYTIAPTSATHSGVGGGGSVTVTAPPGCSWTASSQVDWVTVTGSATGSGSGTVGYAVTANQGPQRSGVMTIAGQSFTVTQAPGSSSTTDADGDSLPDAWETDFGLDPSSDVGANGAAGDPDGDGRTNAQEFEAGTHPRGTHRRFLAEGATGSFFDTRLALVNPGSSLARVLLRFSRNDGTTTSVRVPIQGMRRSTLDVEALAGLAAAEFATVLEADTLVLLDRTQTWDAGGYGAHAEAGLAAPATQWFLAEGSTANGFALFYLLQNSDATTTATVRITYLLPTGAPVVKNYVVPPNTRFNVWVNQIPELAATDVSAVIDVTSGPSLIVERAMYLSGATQLFAAGHESAGVTAPALEWFLAEGATGPFFDEFVLVANPTSSAAQVRVTYLTPSGAFFTHDYVIQPSSRTSIWVDEELIPGHGKVLADTAVSVVVRSTNGVPIVVERAMWWPGGLATWYESHNSPGSTVAHPRWGLAGGEVGGATAHETYILIANPTGVNAPVRVKLLFEDAEPVERLLTVGANSRLNIHVATEFPSAVSKRFGALIESLSAPGRQLVVERAMYSNAAGVVWAAGTNVVATPLP